MSVRQATPHHPKGTGFFLLGLAAWISCGALLKWQTPWLYALAAASVAGALWLGWRRSIFCRGAVLLALVLPVWNLRRDAPALVSVGDDAEAISALVTAEETILALTPKLGTLSKGLLDLQLPSPAGRELFRERFALRDLGPAPMADSTGTAALKTREWPVSPELTETGGATANLWGSLLKEVSWFEYGKVYHIDGIHPGGDLTRFEAKGGFEALAMMKSGEWQSLHGKLRLKWERAAAATEGEEARWQISSWETLEVHGITSRKRLFVEALASAMPSEVERRRVQRSEHYEATVKYYQEGMKNPPHPYFAPISANHKPGVSIADIDGDGFDDIYISVRIGKNLLLRNQGDGTFAEEGAKWGLDLPGHTTCSIFADFDNDGDLDVMLGRSLLKTAYLENTGVRFVQHRAPPFFPMAVVSMAAADYNKDGLLDVYLCTYRAAAPIGSSPSGGVAEVSDAAAFDWPDEFFPPELAKEYRRRLKEKQNGPDGAMPKLLDQLGPPNVLLVNRGAGKFEIAPESASVEIWRNSMQATWGDYDDDGDPDLYVANDWAPDNLMRNDGASGFTDVSTDAGVTHFGFAMGATWGDYDNDGREDMYVSNMYSKAGRRITAKLSGLRKDYAESAEGNWLYHQEADRRFKLVSGLEPPALTVTKAGWSWGGKFADFDNDGFLDLYVLSGYFSAPKELSSELDL